MVPMQGRLSGGDVRAKYFRLLAASPASAQKASPEEVKICNETIKEMTGGKPPAAAVKLCNEGKLNEAIEKAMAG